MTSETEDRAALIAQAAKWHALNPRHITQPAVPVLRERFGLSALEACEALSQARLIWARAH